MRTRHLAAIAASALLLAVATCRDGSHSTAPRSGPPAPREPRTSHTSDGAPVLVGAGDIASCVTTRDEATAALLDNIPGTVITLGDNAYDDGTAADFTNCYEPSWGRHKARTHPTPGERDYQNSAAAYYGYFGAAAGDPATGYYSYDLGSWHIVALNSAIATSATSPQVQWLRADLTANTKPCVLAYWHHPLFFSTGSTGVQDGIKPLWDVLYEFRAEVVLNGHKRWYERFGRQNPAGQADAGGIREFIVGTGGAGTNPFAAIRPNSEVRATEVHGVLKVTLEPTGYSWEFIPRLGDTFTDSGSESCHEGSGPPEPVASVTVSPAQASVDPGQTLQLTATPKDANGNPLSGRVVTWESSNTAVATVTSSGLVTGVATGSATITATSEGQSGTSAITVVAPPPVASVTVSPTRVLVNIGQTVQFTATPKDANGNPLSGRVVTWASSNTAVATVTSSGLVTGVATGSATLTATSEGQGGTSAITVTPPPQSGVVLVGAGDIADCATSTDEATAQLLDTIPGTVFTAGDNAYTNGTAAQFTNCYEPTWGRHKSRTRPAPGNHDYNTSGAAPYYAYFGANAGPAGRGYYAYELGDWHVITLNSEISTSAGSVQEQWLRADLAANTKQCTLAYWHKPRFSSGNHGSLSESQPLWAALYEYNAELVIVGHDHNYERFAPQTADGVADPIRGLRQFVVGTGGTSLRSIGTPIANSEVRNSDTHGVLKLTLRADGYDWEFIPIAGKTFTDRGSGGCH